MTQAANGIDAATGIKVYIFDCGLIDGVTSTEFGFEEGTLPTSMATPCYLIVHPEGVLIWDTGEIPDDEIAEDGQETRKRSFTGRCCVTHA